MDDIQSSLENLSNPDQGSSKDIEDFINEGISNIILSKSEYNADNLKIFNKENLDMGKPTDDYYLNRILKNDESGKSGLTHLEEKGDGSVNVDLFYMSPYSKSELEPVNLNGVKNMDGSFFGFGENLDNFESSLSYQFGLIDGIKTSHSGQNSGTYDYTPNNQMEDKSERNTPDLTYGEHVIYNKIETLQRMIKNMVMTMHEKFNGDSNVRYEAFLRESVSEVNYDFTLAQMFAQKNPKRAYLKLLASHGVIGSFFGSNGHRVQALQQEFNVNVSVTTKRIHFPGSNNKGVLLINGKLYNILRVLRPLYRAIQEEVIRLLIDESVRIEPSKIRLEIEVLIPESLRFTMDRNKYFKQIMEMTGANIRVIKQTYEDGPVQERVLVLFGSQSEIELALEKVALMIQEDSGFKHYSYMNYPDLTVALNASDYAVRFREKKYELDSAKCKKKYSG